MLYVILVIKDEFYGIKLFTTVDFKISDKSSYNR